MKVLKRIVIIILIILAFILGWKLGAAKITKEYNAINAVTLKNELIEINELATYEYTYTDDLEKTSQLKIADKYNIPLTTNSYRICYSGVIKAGIDLNKAEIETEGKTVKIKLPKAGLLDNYVDKDSVIVLDQKNNLIHPIEIQDVFDEIAKENDKHLKTAEDAGLYNFATENAKTLIKKFITNVYGDDAEIKFI